MRRTIYSNDFNDFRGTGFASEPAAGQLDSDDFVPTGFSSASDLSRGETDGLGETTGGIYSVNRGAGDYGVWIQPGGSDFTPGDITLNLNSGSTNLVDVTVSYELLMLNDKERANSFDLQFSLDGVNFVTINSFTSVGPADANGLVGFAISADLPDMAAGTDFQLRWLSDDVSGSGSRDELGFDNVLVEGDETDGPIGDAMPFVESFEAEPGSTYVAAGAFDDGGFDFFGRFEVPTTNGARDDFSNIDGDFAIFAQDNDGEGGPATQVVSIPNINVSGFSRPELTIALGALDSTAFDNYEDGDGIKIFATVDGGARTLIGQFVNDGTAGNLLQDTDLDGFGDGETLTTVLTDFAFDLPVGDLLTLDIEMTSDNSFEPLVVDNVRVDQGPSAAPFVESFEAEPGSTYFIGGAFDDGGFDFFGRFEVPTTNGARDDFSNIDGDFAIFAQDNDGEGGPATQVISIPNIDLTGYDAPALTLSLGALDSSTFDNYEDGDGIKIFATLDGGARILIGQFVNDGTAGNLLQDTNLDGFGDGDALTTVLTDFTFDLPEGDVLSLDIELTSDNSFEPIVVDNVRVGDEVVDTGGDTTLDSDPTLISAIQGDGDNSPLVGQTVVVEAIVTGDFQNADDDAFRDLGGFFLMEETEDQDGDAATSEGLFAFEDGDFITDVSDGDKVRVLGTVVERFGKTTIEVTEVRIEEAEAVDPLSLAVVTALPDVDDREALESMLVTIDEPLTFSESFDYEDFGAATLSTDGEIYQFSQLNTPDVAGNAAYLEEVANRSITIDNGTDGRRGDFDPITEPDGDLINGPVDGIRMGQSIDDLTAIFDFSFGEFALRLPENIEFELDAATNPVQETPDAVGSDYKVGSLNVLNYFTTLDGTIDNGQAPRGADSAEELERQQEKLVETIIGMDADVVGLIEIENDFEGATFAIKTLVAEINATLGDDIWDFVDPGAPTVGDDAIAVAFIYDTTTTELVGGVQVLDTLAFLDPLGAGLGGDAFNRAALAQTFEEIESGGIFTASVNHFKSKGSLTGAPEDVDQNDGAGNNNATRTAAAEELAAWLDTDPTGSGDEDFLILGDLNAYASETPITTLTDAGYTDLARAFEGDDVTSYRFSGQVGTLDYALSNAALTDQVTGTTTWNVNGNTPVFFDYNLDGTFTGQDRPTDQGLFDGDTALRGSDHDPVIVGLDLDDDGNTTTGTDGNDALVGGDGEDVIESGGGAIDVGTGGASGDIFVFTDIDGARDQLRILDFNLEEDAIDLGGATVLSSLTVGPNLFIRLAEDGDSIFVVGVTDINDITFVDDLSFV